MDFENEPQNSRSRIFQNNVEAIEFLKHHGLLNINMVCPKCSGHMRIEYDPAYSSSHRLRCSDESCNKSKTLFEGLKMGEFKIDLFEYFFYSLFMVGKKL